MLNEPVIIIKGGSKMKDSLSINDVKSEIRSFSEKLKELPNNQLENGNWFAEVLKMVLTDHAKKVDGDYFKKKYLGSSNEKIAYKLIKTASNYTALAGLTAASAISAAELYSPKMKKGSLALGASTFFGEIAYISYMQLKLIYDLSIVMDARLDKNDPEDMLTIFWYSLGVNTWENVARTALPVGVRSTAYLGRKALRSGIRKAITKFAAEIGGQKLARKITEKAMLKFIVPVVNLPIAFYLNKNFTKKLGEIAIKSFKTRGVTIKTIDKLSEFDRYYQILAIPLIFQIGIFSENDKCNSKNIEMQNNVLKRLLIQSDEEKIIDDLVEMDFDDFCEVLSKIDNEKVAHYLFDIATYSHLMCNNSNQEKFVKLSNALKIDLEEVNFEKYKNNLGK